MAFRQRFLILAVSFVALARMVGVATALDPLAYTSLGNLSVPTGTLTFNTDTLSITGGGGGLTSTSGVTQTQVGGPTIAVFDFTNVSIAGGVTVQVTGSRPIAILSRGDAIIDAAVNISGANGSAGTPGVNGNNGSGGTVGNVDGNSGGFGGPAPTGGEPGGKGGDGGYNTASGQTGLNGSGAALGGIGGATGNPGGAGANGTAGAAGTAGGAGNNAPVLSNPSVLTGGADGATGAAGTNGRGGGGGGGGGGQSGPVITPGKGHGGGAGGAGGTGGTAGTGGQGGRGIEVGAVGAVTLSAQFTSRGGNGGAGGGGGSGGAGGPGVLTGGEVGSGGNGGPGGFGGTGGSGGGGGGGLVYLHGQTVYAPSADVRGGLRPVVGDLGGSGLFRLEGTTSLHVNGTTAGQYDRVDVQGQLQLVGGAKFLFPNEQLATTFQSAPPLNFDSFFSLNSLPVPDLTPYQSLSYSATSPGRTFSVTLNPNRTLTFIRNIVPPTAWTDGTGSWNTAANWNLGVPSATNPAVATAYIQNGGTAQIIGGSANVLELRVGGTGPGNLVVDGGNLNVTLDFQVASSSGASSATIQGAGTVTSPSTIVNGPNASMTITGTNTIYTATADFTVASSGTGNPQLFLQNGGRLNSPLGVIGALPGSNGTVTISGINSRWTSDLMLIGQQGSATLTIQSGGRLSAGETRIAAQPGSMATVTVTGPVAPPGQTGALTGSVFTVGHQGTATLNITNGGFVNAGSSTIGKLAGSFGTATVTGAGSAWFSNSLTVGDQGSGGLSILDNGYVSATSLAIGSQGGVLVQGGWLRLTTATGVDRLNFSSGTLELTGDRDSSEPITFAQFGFPSVISAGRTFRIEGDFTVTGQNNL